MSARTMAEAMLRKGITKVDRDITARPIKPKPPSKKTATYEEAFAQGYKNGFTHHMSVTECRYKDEANCQAYEAGWRKGDADRNDARRVRENKCG